MAQASSGAIASSPADSEASQAVETLKVGVYQTDKPSVMYAKFQPVVEALSATASAKRVRPLRFELVILKTYEQGLDAIVDGAVDLMRVGPASYILARERDPGVRIAAMELKQGQKRFKGVIVVRADSDIHSLGDIRGRSFAFGDESSTIGRYLAQARLLDVGIDASALSRHEFLGRHDKVAKAVELGDFDAGSVKSSTFKKANANGTLRVVDAFDNVTKPWIARPGLPDELFEVARESLIGLRDPEVLAALKVSELAAGDDGDYDVIRAAMKKARAFDPTGK